VGWCIKCIEGCYKGEDEIMKYVDMYYKSGFYKKGALYVLSFYQRLLYKFMRPKAK